MVAVSTIFVYNRDGLPFSLDEVCQELGVSRSWLHRNRFKTPLLEDLRVLTKKIKTRPRYAKPRMGIKAIPVGTWEKENVRCPPAQTMSGKDVLRDCWHENDHYQRDRFRLKGGKGGG